MEMKLSNGNYISDGDGGFEMVSGAEEILQRIIFKLMCHRGKYPVMPKLGSNLYLLCREKKKDLDSVARNYIFEALEDERNLELVSMETTYLDVDKIKLDLGFLWYGSEIELSLTV